MLKIATKNTNERTCENQSLVLPSTIFHSLAWQAKENSKFSTLKKKIDKLLPN